MDFGDTPYEHLYIDQTHPYYRAPHVYLALPARFIQRDTRPATRARVGSRRYRLSPLRRTDAMGGFLSDFPTGNRGWPEGMPQAFRAPANSEGYSLSPRVSRAARLRPTRASPIPNPGVAPPGLKYLYLGMRAGDGRNHSARG